MKHFVLFASLYASLSAASPVSAQQTTPETRPSFSIELTAQEGQLLAGMLDQNIKQGGYQAAKQAIPIIDKMIEASAKAKVAADDAAKKAEFERMKAKSVEEKAP